MQYGKQNLSEKFGLFEEQWRPKVVAELNGQELKLVKAQGVFPWHKHDHADELFLCWRGTLRVEFRDHSVTLEAGELTVVPAGVEHRTAADAEAEVLIFVKADVRNTGDVEDSEFTAPGAVRI